MEYKLTNTLLCLDNISIAYGDNVVIKDFTMIEKDVVIEGQNTGQTIAILGPSGGGKSSIFKALTGLLKPSSGSVLIAIGDGSDGKAKIVEEGDVGFVNQKYTLFRHKTVEQILMYALRNSKMTKEEKNATIDEHLTSWNLERHRKKFPNELSGGQRQRTAILEQVISSSRYIVFDEPASGLDVGNIEKLKDTFKLISNQDDLNTIIFSTHDINLAVELADSIYVIGRPDPEATYSTKLAHYDLKEMGLAWRPFDERHLALVQEIKRVIVESK